jgi:hypothetical protein
MLPKQKKQLLKLIPDLIGSKSNAKDGSNDESNNSYIKVDYMGHVNKLTIRNYNFQSVEKIEVNLDKNNEDDQWKLDKVASVIKQRTNDKSMIHNPDVKRVLQKIPSLINEKSFVEFDGMDGNIQLQFYKNGWKKDKDPTLRIERNYNSNNIENNLDAINNYINKVANAQTKPSASQSASQRLKNKRALQNTQGLER